MSRRVAAGLWLLAAAAAGCGRTGGESGSAPAPDADEAARAAPVAQTAAPGRDGLRTLVYRCGDSINVVTRLSATGDSMELFLPGRTARLAHREAASGARYASGALSFWSEGEDATLEMPDGPRVRCRADRYESVWEDARLRDVGFRAVGNEPGWKAEISLDSIRLVLDYGDRRLAVPTPGTPALEDEGRTVYVTRSGEGEPLEIAIVRETCHDAAGHELEARVELRLGDRTYRGCGRSLR